MSKSKFGKHYYDIPYVHPFNREGDDVCTVGQLKKMLEQLDDDIIVLVGTDTWYNNIESAIFPDNDGTTCLTFVQGEPYDTRYPNPFPFEHEDDLDEETARFVEEFTKSEDREPTEDEIAKFRENAYEGVAK